MRSTTNPTALASWRIDWRRERDRTSESALSRSDCVCWNVMSELPDKVEECSTDSREISVELPDVYVIPQTVSPTATHLSLAIEAFWRSCRTRACEQKSIDGRLSHRDSVSAILHAWCAMESCVNIALYQKLKNKESSYYKDPIDRAFPDKHMAKNLNKSLPFWDRLLYLQENQPVEVKSVCNCNTVPELQGEIGQFEKLRNHLAHGYCRKKEILLELIPGTEQTTTTGTTVQHSASYSSEDEQLLDDGGKAIDWKKDFQELGLVHDPTSLCRHDAMNCIYKSLRVIYWVNAHFFLPTNVLWEHNSKRYAFYSNAPAKRPTGITKFYVGITELYEAMKEVDRLTKEQKNQRVNRGIPTPRTGGRRRKRRKT